VKRGILILQMTVNQTNGEEETYNKGRSSPPMLMLMSQAADGQSKSNTISFHQKNVLTFFIQISK
jgi:hypothetical protein